VAGLLDLYYRVEEKWYGLLDKLNSKIPVYKIIDPIDNVIPSFLLFLLIVVAIAVFLLLPFILPFIGQGANFEIIVLDSQGNPVKEAGIQLKINNTITEGATDTFGKYTGTARMLDEIKVLVTATGYITKNVVFTINDPDEEFIIKLENELFLGTNQRIIKFVDPTGKQITDKEIKAEFHCSSFSGGFNGTIMNTSSGEIVIDEPSGCGVLSFIATAKGYESSSESVDGIMHIAVLNPIEEPETGSARFFIKDEETGALLDGIRVSVYRENNTLVDSSYADWGEVTILLAPGLYYMSVNDPTGNYGSYTENFAVNANDITIIEVGLSENVQVVLDVTVVEEIIGIPVGNAKVDVLNSSGDFVSSMNTDLNGNVKMKLTDTGIFYVRASAEGYFPSDDLDVNAFYPSTEPVPIRIELHKITDDDMGRVEITVIDEDLLRVEGAEVFLLYSDSGFVAPYGSRYTDLNGIIDPIFRGVKEGSYIASVQKYPATGESLPFDVETLVYNTQVVNIVIGEGIISVNAANSDGEAIPFASADIMDASGEILGTISLNEFGQGSFNTKADKQIFVKVYAEGFTSWNSRLFQVLPEQHITFDAVLKVPLQGETPKITLQGLYERRSSYYSVSMLEAGKLYDAVFEIEVPASPGIDKLGMHFRVGENAGIEQDVLFIEAVNAPHGAVVRGKTYIPPYFDAIDSINITNGDAKWVNITWLGENIEPGIYEVSAAVRIRQETIPGTLLPIHYRAWIENSGRWLRDPYDSDLMEQEISDSKDSLYAYTYSREFLEGKDEYCFNNFCTSERIFDPFEGIYFTDPPFTLRVGQEYELRFTITNDGFATYSNAALQIFNTSDGISNDDTIRILGYEIVNADGISLSDNSNAYTIGEIDTGIFSPAKTIMGTLRIKPEKPGHSNIRFRMIADQLEVFSNEVSINSRAENKLKLEISPEEFGAYIPAQYQIKVLEAEGANSGQGIGEATVLIKVDLPIGGQRLYTGVTDDAGIATFDMEGFATNTIITISAEKRGYYGEELVKTVRSDVVVFNPQSLTFNLDVTTQTESIESLTVTNIVQKTLVLQNAIIGGSFQGLLDELRMQNWAASLEGQDPLRTGESTRIDILTALSTEGKDLIDPMILNGELMFEFADTEMQTIWPQEIPFVVNINIGDLPSEEECLTLSMNNWTGTTIENRITENFTIRNDCMREDIFVELEDLQAKLDWKGNVIGEVELVLVDPETGLQARQVLRQRTWTDFISQVEPGKEYLGTLVFVPMEDSLGETAIFDIEFEAKIRTNTGLEPVGASNPIQARLLIVNLEQCILITPDPKSVILISETESSAEFNVDTSGCGDEPLDLRFCEGGVDRCKGGSTEGGINLNRWQLDSVNPGDTVTISVSRSEIPGYYGIPVDAKITGMSWREVADIEVLIEPQEFNYFKLDKYNFTIIGEGSQDTATLTNRMLREVVEVTANICAWMVALDSEYFNGASPFTNELERDEKLKLYAIIGYPFFQMFYDACEEELTADLYDYVITLTDQGEGPRKVESDALDIVMDNPNISAEYNLEVADVFVGGDNEMQQVGVVFTNDGLDDPKPTYSVATFTATEHFNGDPFHQNAGVFCGSVEVSDPDLIEPLKPDLDNRPGENENEQIGVDTFRDYEIDGDFGNYWLPAKTCTNVSEKIYTQKFHLKFISKTEGDTLPPINNDTASCVSGIDIGRTGVGALPRIKLDWTWQDNVGIEIDSCDYDNPNSVYCDATQFNIELNKRLFSMYSFLEANGFELNCNTEDSAEAFNSNYSNREVPEGWIGLEQLELSVAGSTSTLKARIANKTSESQDVNVLLAVGGSGFYIEECEKMVIGIPEGGVTEVDCSFQYQESDSYRGIARIQNSPTTNQFIGEELITELEGNNAALDESFCNDKTTKIVNGDSAINRFINDTANIQWTEDITSTNEVNNLIKFRVYLMEDSFSPDFLLDFADYYTNYAFFDADSYFYSLSVDSNNQSYGINRLYESGNIKFKRRYVDDYRLPAAGLYDVEITMDFSGDDWRYFDGGTPKVEVTVSLYRLDDAFPNSPFYAMPINGNVGLIGGNEYERQEYGSEFVNSRGSEIKINDTIDPVYTYPGSGSNPISTVDVEKGDDLYSMNVSPDTRGMLLSLERTGEGQYSMIFSPGRAIPVMLRASNDSNSDSSYAVYYTMSEGENRVNLGDTLLFWSGAGACRDFTGIPVYEAFRSTPDRPANESTDNIPDVQNIYAIDWGSVDFAGDVYLKTIVYTPLDYTYSLRNYQDSWFLTPDNEGDVVELTGISTMELNRSGLLESDSIDSIEDIFDLVRNEKVCASSLGTKVKYFWNPKALYEQAGQVRSILETELALVPGETCIG